MAYSIDSTCRVEGCDAWGQVVHYLDAEGVLQVTRRCLEHIGN